MARCGEAVPEVAARPKVIAPVTRRIATPAMVVFRKCVVRLSLGREEAQSALMASMMLRGYSLPLVTLAFSPPL